MLLVTLQCNIGFWSRFQWFFTYIQHPVLIMTNALFNTHHPSSPSTPHPPPSTVSLISSLRVTYGLFPSLLFSFSPFPYVHLFSFLNSTEIIGYLFFSDWLISLSVIYSSSSHAIVNGKISFFWWLSSIPLCIYTPPLLYPFTSRWTFGLSPWFGYC